jgi:hypothetical protein
MATNSITNTFAHNLHGDSLAQFAAASAYYVMLRYGETRERWLLAAMAILVAVGFMIKQNQAAWLAWNAVFLVMADRSWKRMAAYFLMGTLLLAATLAGCYAIWGTPFFYWCFSVLMHHPISPLRAFQHVLAAWPYFAAGLLGGAVILYHRNSRVLLSAWLVWLAVIGNAAYTSGVAWMLNHMGPGCLLAGVWFLAGISTVWNRAAEIGSPAPSESWIRVAMLTVAVLLSFSGLGLIRIPVQAVPDDAYRYVREIEAQFQGKPARQVLLDAGTWIYFKNRVVMGDRAPGIGERGYSETADFSGVLSRIASKRYARILVRGYHDADFVYDYYLWAKPSGIRRALKDNYRETGSIRAVQAAPEALNWAEDPYYVGEITILEPKGQ